RPIEDHAQLIARLRQIDGVVSASATTYDGAFVRGKEKNAYAVLRGVEEQGGQLLQADKWLIEGSFAPLFETPKPNEPSVPGAVIGAELATRLGGPVGDRGFVLPANLRQRS